MEKQIKPEMGRRQFLGAAATALFAGVVVQILGCEEKDYGTSPTTSPSAPNATPVNANPASNGPVNAVNPSSSTSSVSATPDNTATIAATKGVSTSEANHPNPVQHIATITGATLDAGAGYILNIQGNSVHNHTCTYNATDIANIKAGFMVYQESSLTESHTHGVTFNPNGATGIFVHRA
jgi:hypothetical protein